MRTHCASVRSMCSMHIRQELLLGDMTLCGIVASTSGGDVLWMI